MNALEDTAKPKPNRLPLYIIIHDNYEMNVSSENWSENVSQIGIGNFNRLVGCHPINEMILVCDCANCSWR